MTKLAGSKTDISLRIDSPNGGRFGPGKAALLREISNTGSIAGSARTLGMSYPKALKLIDEMNLMFSSEVVETRHGGEDHGGTQLTESGRSILQIYERAVEAALQATEPNRAALDQFLKS